MPLNPRRDKHRTIRLAAEEYGQLRRQVLERDGWRCQDCGARQHLEVHHLRHRSHGGQDAEHNLITLCSACHRMVHRCPAPENTP